MYAKLSKLLDEKHRTFNLFGNPFSQEIWKSRYKAEKDLTIFHTFTRVAHAIAAPEGADFSSVEWFNKFEEVMSLGLFMPAGRILASAGLDTQSTLQNCYVSTTIADSTEGIMQAYGEAMITLGRFGGIGMDFTPIRPKGAKIGSQGLKSPGVVHWMDMWHQGADKIKQAGHRRGAMMGTLADHHPDILDFIEAKHTKGALTNFNVSVLISDAFMQAVKDDGEWYLYHEAPRDGVLDVEKYRIKGKDYFIYGKMLARELWDKIMRSTYEFAEPGVIFIDKINQENNLWYCEDIRCTNPCVSGDTLILTDFGYVPIKSRVGLCTPVWNGHEWSDVEPFSTGTNQLFKVRLSNGAVVRTTAYHKWLLRSGARVETCNLNATNELDVHEFPVIEFGSTFNIDAYSQGFYSGDGTKDSDYSNLYKHEEGIRNRLVGKIYNRNCESQPGHRWVHGKMLPKDFVPVGGTPEYCVNWLAGLLDADGNIARPSKDAMPVIQLNAKDRNFLERLRLMLTRLGVNARFWERQDAGLKYGSNGKQYMCESTACLMIAGKGSYQLAQLGMKTERLDMSWVREPIGKARVGVKVVSVEPDGIEETFCLTEPKRNTFIANGVLTSNCGEQPLPPYGACNLGHINLARMVTQPFGAKPDFNFKLLEETVRIAVRFLDNVIDVSNFPLDQQKEEQINKRRIGLGVSGLADMFIQMGITYGSARSVDATKCIMENIAAHAYDESCNIAKEKGAFPLFDKEKYGSKGFASRMPLGDVNKHLCPQRPIRNSLLLTVAPTGTTSIIFGNISSGIEPNFAFRMERKVWVENNKSETHLNESFISEFYKHCGGDKIEHERYAVKASHVDVVGHIAIQAAAQKWIDASVTKTVNCPTDMSFEDFKNVYTDAYASGCKGCTTYRPSEVRGSVLEDADNKPEPEEPEEIITLTALGREKITQALEELGHVHKPDMILNTPEGLVAVDFKTVEDRVVDSIFPDEHRASISLTELVKKAYPERAKRPEMLKGHTYKIKWPHHNDNIYLTINEDEEGKPYEIFLASMDLRTIEWMVLNCILASQSLRHGENPLELAKTFQKIQGASEGSWVNGKYYTSLPAYIGKVLEDHFSRGVAPAEAIGTTGSIDPVEAIPVSTGGLLDGKRCIHCGAPAVFRVEGCEKCMNCGDTKCG